MITITCSSCGKGLRVKDELAGRKGKCPQCGETVQIPAAQSAVPDFVSLDKVAEVPAPEASAPARAAGEEPFQFPATQFHSNVKRKGQPGHRSGRSKGMFTALVATIGLVALLGVSLWLVGFFSDGDGAPAVADNHSTDHDDADGETASTEDDGENQVDAVTPHNVAIADNDDPAEEPDPTSASPMPVPMATGIVDTSRLAFAEESDELLDFVGAKALAFSPDGSLLVAAGETPDGRPMLMSWEVDSWTKLHETSTDVAYNMLAFAPDGESLYAASGEDEQIVMIDADTLSSTGQLVDDGVVISFSLARDGTLASVTSDDWGIQLWKDGAKAIAWEGAGVTTTCLEFSHDGRLLASTGERTLLWDVARGEIAVELSEEFASYTSFGASFSRDDSALAVSCNDAITRTWSVPQGTALEEFEGSQPNVFAVRYSPDGRMFLTRSMAALDASDSTSVFMALAEGASLRLWNAATGEDVELSSEVSIMETDSFLFSPDGSTIAATGNDGVRIWVGK